MKIVLNSCYGGWSVNETIASQLGMDSVYNTEYRTNPALINAIELLGADQIDGRSAQLRVVEIPDDCHYHIVEYDGIEDIYWSESPINIV